MNLKHGIADCDGYEIVEALEWVFEGADASAWGFLLCRSPQDGDLYAALGPARASYVEGTCLGVRVSNPPSPAEAIARFALACGLSAVQLAEPEPGDSIVVAGANRLATSLLAAARAHGVHTVCLVPERTAEVQLDRLSTMADDVVAAGFTSALDETLDAVTAQTTGKVIYADTSGEPDLVYLMAGRLSTFGTLLFCRPDVDAAAILNVYLHVHRPSATVTYWNRPQNLESALSLSDCLHRSANLIDSNRVPGFQPALS